MCVNHSEANRRNMASTRERDDKMNSSLNHGSAKIYQFPAGGRAALGGRRYEETKTADGFCHLVARTEAACSDSWYHEAAIQESKPAWER